jgi:hypothetical protein
MPNSIYIIEETSKENTFTIGYHTDLKKAEEYLERLTDLFNNDSSHYFITEAEHLEDVDFLNDKFEEYEIEDDWDEYDEKWDEYNDMYDCDFEPIKKHRGKLKDY